MGKVEGGKFPYGLGLSIRAINGIKHYADDPKQFLKAIRTYEGMQDVLAMPNFGRKTLMEIYQATGIAVPVRPDSKQETINEMACAIEALLHPDISHVGNGAGAAVARARKVLQAAQK